jgi:hypothetical protein
MRATCAQACDSAQRIQRPYQEEWTTSCATAPFQSTTAARQHVPPHLNSLLSLSSTDLSLWITNLLLGVYRVLMSAPVWTVGDDA